MGIRRTPRPARPHHRRQESTLPTATVVVLAEVDDVEINIPDSDIEIDVYARRAAGARTCRKFHGRCASPINPRHRGGLPGRALAVAEQTARHVHFARAAVRNRTTETPERIGGKRRSSRLPANAPRKSARTNYPQSRVTDHRIGVSSYNLPVVMDATSTLLSRTLTRDEGGQAILGRHGYDDE